MSTLFLISCLIIYIVIGLLIAKFFVDHQDYTWRIDIPGGVLLTSITWPVVMLLYWVWNGINKLYNL